MPWTLGSRRSRIGVDIGGRLINAVQLDHSGAIESATTVRRTEPGAPIERAECERLVTVLERQGFHGRRVVVAVPDRQLMTAQLELPPVASGAPIEDIARHDLAAAHECAPESIEVAIWSPGGAPERGAARGLGVGCARNEIDALLDAFEGAGLLVEALDAPAWPMWRAVQQVGGATTATIMLRMDWFASHLIAVTPETVQYERMLPDLGLCRFHEKLVDEMGLDVEATDHILAEVDLSSAAVEEGSNDLSLLGRELLLSFADELASEVRQSLEYCGQLGVTGYEEVLLVGEGAEVRGMDVRLAEQLGLVTRVCRPDPNLRTEVGADRNLPRLITAFGLALFPGGRRK